MTICPGRVGLLAGSNVKLCYSTKFCSAYANVVRVYCTEALVYTAWISAPRKRDDKRDILNLWVITELAVITDPFGLEISHSGR